MEIINLDRARGKTYLLVEESSKNNIPIVCSHYSSKRYIETMATDRGLRIPPVILAHELFAENSKGNCVKYDKVYVDDVDCVLEQLLGCLNVKEVVKGTITAGNEGGKTTNE